MLVCIRCGKVLKECCDIYCEVTNEKGEPAGVVCGTCAEALEAEEEEEDEE